MTDVPELLKGRKIEIFAPAKINLFLHITGRRDDGYHLLESLLVFADFGDKITVEENDEMAFSVTGPYAGVCRNARCDGMSNLAARAGVLLREAAGTQKNARIELEKNLPLSAGLGGGSADAAAALRALQILWGVKIEEDKLFSLALKLGADVPACLLGEPCFVSGIGENISPVRPFEDLFCVLINPNTPLSTPKVFQSYAKEARSFSPPLALTEELNEGIWQFLEGTLNDLEASAISLSPNIKVVLDALKGQPGYRIARMSGSGATCFGLFESKSLAEGAALVLKNENPGWWVFACTLTRRN